MRPRKRRGKTNIKFSKIAQCVWSNVYTTDWSYYQGNPYDWFWRQFIEDSKIVPKLEEKNRLTKRIIDGFRLGEAIS